MEVASHLLKESSLILKVFLLTLKVMLLILSHRTNLDLKPFKVRLNRGRWSMCGMMAIGMRWGRYSRCGN